MFSIISLIYCSLVPILEVCIAFMSSYSDMNPSLSLSIFSNSFLSSALSFGWRSLTKLTLAAKRNVDLLPTYTKFYKLSASISLSAMADIFYDFTHGCSNASFIFILSSGSKVRSFFKSYWQFLERFVGTINFPAFIFEIISYYVFP